MFGRPLGKPFDDVDSEVVRFCVEKGAEEPYPPSENKPLVFQYSSLFVTDILPSSPRRDFYAQGLDALEKVHLIALAQILLQTLDAFIKESYVCSVADPLNVRAFLPDSSLQLTVLRISLVPPSDYLSRGHDQVHLCFCVASPHNSRPGSLRSRGGATCSAVCSMAVAKVVFTSSTLLSLGGAAPKWSPNTVAAFWWPGAN